MRTSRNSVHANFGEFALQHQLALDCSEASILTPFATLFEPLYDPFVSQYANGVVFSGSYSGFGAFLARSVVDASSMPTFSTSCCL